MQTAALNPPSSLSEMWLDPAVAELWNLALSVAEQSLLDCAASHGIALRRVESGCWDAPSVTASWQSPEVRRNVQVILHSSQFPLEFEIRGAADSVDTGHQSEHHWSDRLQVATAASEEQFAALLARSLPGAFAEINRLAPDSAEWSSPQPPE